MRRLQNISIFGLARPLNCTWYNARHALSIELLASNTCERGFTIDCIRLRGSFSDDATNVRYEHTLLPTNVRYATRMGRFCGGARKPH